MRRQRIIGPSFPFLAQVVSAPPTSTLKTGLVAWYDLEEAGDSQRNDAHTNGFHLTLTDQGGGGGFGNATGKKGNAFKYNSGGLGFFGHVDDALMDFTGDFSSVVWINTPLSPANLPTGLGKSTVWTVSHSAGTDGPILQIWDVSAPFGSIFFLTDTHDFNWYCVVLRRSPSGVSLRGQLFNSSGTELENLTDPTAGTVVNKNTNLLIGPSGTFSDNRYLVDSWGIWSRLLSDAEVTFLVNGGAGRAYSEL